MTHYLSLQLCVKITEKKCDEQMQIANVGKFD